MSEPRAVPASQPEPAAEPRIDVLVTGSAERRAAELAELREALLEAPRRIPTRYFYDERGSALFEAICELPEYYQTRTEAALLERHAAEIARTTRAADLVELGSGAATKTRILLDALAAEGTLARYVPLDVDPSMVRRVAEEMRREYPGIEIHGIAADFLEHLTHLPPSEETDGCRLVIFLGGTIGNLLPERARWFLAELAGELDPGDYLLLGTDRIKDVDRLEAAYDDSRGVTAEFNRNVLRVVDRLTGGDFDPDRFRHRAFYDRENHRIEMRLVSTEAQRVTLPELDLVLDLEAGEEISTEISTKFDRPLVEKLLDAGGFALERFFEDEERLFSLSLARRG